MRFHLMAPLAILTLALGLALAVGCGGNEPSGAAQGLQGWEMGGAYDKNYDTAEYDKIKGYFKEFVYFTPSSGMAEGMGIVMEDRADGELVTVHVGPRSYVEDELKRLDLREGEKIKAYGSWAFVNDKDVLMATKIKRNEEQFVKVRRTADGHPYWEMTPEQVQAELTGGVQDDDSDEAPEGAPAG